MEFGIIEEEFSDICELLKAYNKLLFNHQTIYERELSIYALNNTKRFEREFRIKFCKIMHQYALEDDDTDYNFNRVGDCKIFLETINIVWNAPVIYIKGLCEICIDGIIYNITMKHNFVFDSADIKFINNFYTNKRIVTVENLVAFNRLNDESCVYIYIAGYSSPNLLRFIKEISSYLPQNHEYRHFGDIDPDGFLILERIKKITCLNFTPYKMGVNELTAFSLYSKKMEQEDIKKARKLLSEGKHFEIMSYLLENNVKLEQEIIALKQSQ